MLATHRIAGTADQEGRIARLLVSPIPFISNEQFELLEPEVVRCLPKGESLYRDESQASAADFEGAGSLSYYQRLPLLSVAGEQHLFRKMNYLRFRADRLRSCLDSECPDPRTLTELEEALHDADAAANQIAECNLRLVISIARKFATNAQEFDELVSEGNMIMLKAIEKFDFDRGFRFSTYATHSVQRHIYRWSRTRQRRRRKELAASSELLHSVPEGDRDDAPVDDTQAVDAVMHKINECLDEREQIVVRRRFGLGDGGKKRPLREIASEIGLSKERVRQIQVAAIRKLQDAFGHVDLETFCRKATA